MSDSPYPPLFRAFGIKDLGVVPARSLGLKDLLVTSLRTNDLVRDPSLRSGFRQRAPASLTPAKRLNLTFQRALKMGLGQIRGRKDPSLRSGFRQRAPASLTPAKRLNLTFQRALKMGLGRFRGPSWWTGLETAPIRSLSSRATGLMSMDFDHRLGVMKGGLFGLPEAHHGGRVGIEHH